MDPIPKRNLLTALLLLAAVVAATVFAIDAAGWVIGIALAVLFAVLIARTLHDRAHADVISESIRDGRRRRRAARGQEER